MREANRPTYDGLRDLIDTLAPVEVDIGAARVAKDYAKFFEGIGAPCPRAFWHGGDAIVFTWDTPEACWYITLTDDGAVGVLGAPPQFWAGRASLQGDEP